MSGKIINLDFNSLVASGQSPSVVLYISTYLILNIYNKCEFYYNINI